MDRLGQEPPDVAPLLTARRDDRQDALHETLPVVALGTEALLAPQYGDHLGSVSLMTNSSKAAVSQQEFDAWGKVRSGGISQTSINYTGQRLDGTGLLYYNARYYDPAIGRFLSADTVVPGNASGGMDGIAVKPLTVSFSEEQFLKKLNLENQKPFWFQMNSDQRRELGSPWGSSNPQALNRYTYVLNNPLKYTDPSGHTWYLSQSEAAQLAAGFRAAASELSLVGTIDTLVGVGSVLAKVLVKLPEATSFGQEIIRSVLSRVFAFAAALITLYAVSANLVANEFNAIAELIETSNGSQGVAIALDDDGLYALNRKTGASYYLDTWFFSEMAMPDTLRLGAVEYFSSPPEEGDWMFRGDYAERKKQIQGK